VPDDAAAYLLLAVDLLVVALVLTLPLLALWWLVGRPRRSAAEPQQQVLRRCDACGIGWKGTPGDDARVVTLKLRRWQRRRTRERKQDTPGWARRRGWSRCPSCLSRQVRTSSRHASER
jgi:hypothetical protein